LSRSWKKRAPPARKAEERERLEPPLAAQINVRDGIEAGQHAR
jgi:hypothetical protein